MSKKSKRKDKKSKKNSQPQGYQPTGDSVSWEVAMSQAITALDHSAEIAISSGSSSGMADIARGWLAVAEMISESAGGGQEHDISNGPEDYPLGFRAPAPIEEYIDEEEEVDDNEFRAHHTFPTSRVGRSKRRFRQG